MRTSGVMIAGMRALGVMALGTMALGASACGPRSAAEETSRSEDGLARPRGAVQVLDLGTYAIPSDCTRHMFWADIAVRNDAYHKTVGVVWTTDGWRTTRKASAHYEASLGDGYERWGLNEEGSVTCRGYGTVSDVEFAVFVTMNGRTSWDPYNNYNTDGSVTRDRPVHLRSVRAGYGEGHGVVTGDVRVLDLAREKQVSVRYTDDGWRTSREVDARYAEANRWVFRIDDLAPLPDRVELALRYRVRGEEHWDNNGRRNYAVRLAPAYEEGGFGNIPTDGTVSGIVYLTGRWVTDIPTVGTQVRVDDAPFGPEFSYSGGLLFSTLDLSDGAHRADFRLDLENGLAVTHTRPIVVDNVIRPVEHWVPSGIPEYDAARQMTADASGQVYLLADHTVLRYEGPGDAAPKTLCTLPEDQFVLGIDADIETDGSVYATLSDFNSTALVRCTEAAGLDPSFATHGRFDLSPHFRRYRGRVLVRGGYAFAVDMCAPAETYPDPGCLESRVVRIRLADGTVTAATYPEDSPSDYQELGDSYYFNGFPGPIAHDGSSLWLLRHGNPVVLMRFATDSTGAFTLLDSTRVSDTSPLGGNRIIRTETLTRDSEGTLWAASGDSVLVALTPDAQIVGAWRGGGEVPGFYTPASVYLGGFRGALALVPRSGAPGVLLLAEQPEIVTFTRRP